MIIEFQKRKDGSLVLRCIRDDGSATYDRPKPSHSEFFALHDLTHVAVESVLGQLRGFFSLINSGWEVVDFENAKEAGVSIPDETGLVELIVGFMDAQGATDSDFSADELNRFICSHYQDRVPLRFRLSPTSLDSMIRLRQRLLADWVGLERGKSLIIEFPIPIRD